MTTKFPLSARLTLAPGLFHLGTRNRLILVAALSGLLATPVFAATPEVFSVRDFDAKADGKTDDTQAFQKALDAAAQAGGGTVAAGRGNFFFAGHLDAPSGVALTGIWKSVPAHNGLRDRGLPKPTDDGTTFLVTEGAGQESGAAFITLHTNSTFRASSFIIPNQKQNDVPEAVSLGE